MAKRILIALALACWFACTSFALLYLAPVMFFSPRPEMVLIAGLVPALWLICSVLSFIAWADAGWGDGAGNAREAHGQPTTPQYRKALLSQQLRMSEVSS
ncbi:hypothetical protein TUM18999_57730 [Pseudomonas tohonis]|uniref:Uncharacterized protein n=1 Tax=Pseudomonas tohonis TaxID=2725477 RepID=A0A6J4ECX5_9PSED|nr:hypothetical protein [Pseudomonas tohonis]BCG27582.1 hypothetical protein TUM18999_57730 [Pseudomonas tohonis]